MNWFNLGVGVLPLLMLVIVLLIVIGHGELRLRLRAALTAVTACIGARASWSAPVHWRFLVNWRFPKSARGLAHSKTWRTFVAAFCIPVALLTTAERLHAQPVTAANHVLDLDGKDSYVELPPNIFNAL